LLVKSNTLGDKRRDVHNKKLFSVDLQKTDCRFSSSLLDQK
jgi:hypothetical protein